MVCVAYLTAGQITVCFFDYFVGEQDFLLSQKQQLAMMFYNPLLLGLHGINRLQSIRFLKKIILYRIDTCVQACSA